MRRWSVQVRRTTSSLWPGLPEAMHLEHLWLTDFRSYPEAEFGPAPTGITVVSGANGEGKTNLLEAIGYLATCDRSGAARPRPWCARSRGGRAVVRAEGVREGRRLLIEAELHASGRDRVQVNRQPLRRSRDLLGAFCVTVFAPDDLGLVKGGPQGRREYLDDLLVALHPRHDATIAEVERVLKQRNALLKSAGAAGAGRPCRRTWSPPSTCGTPSWPRPVRRWSTAREALTARPGAPVWARPTAGWPRAWPTGAEPRSAVATSGAGTALHAALAEARPTTCAGG